MSFDVQTGLGRVLPDRLQRSYLAKTAVVFVTILLLVSGVGGYQYVQAVDHVSDDAQQDLLETAKENRHHFMAWGEAHYETTKLVSNSGELASDETTDAYLASQHSQLSSDVVALSVIDLDSGAVRASTSETVVGTTMSAIQTQDGMPTFESASEIHMGQKHEWQGESAGGVIPFVSPVQGAPTRALVVTVATEPIDELLAQDGVTTHLIGPNGLVLFDSTNQNTFKPYPADSAAVDRALAGESGVIEQDEVPGLVNEPHLVAYVPFEGGLAVLVHQPTSTAYSLAGDMTGIFVSILLATVIGFVAFGWYLSRSTARPLRGLASKVRALRDGDLDVDLRTDRRDEFGAVLDGISELRGDLRDQRRDAEAYSGVMETAAEGDLTARMDTDSSNHDMHVIATTYNAMMDELEETVRTVRRFSDDVATLSEQMAGSADEVNDAGEEVSRSVQQIAEGAADQNETLLGVASSMNEMSASIGQIAASADQLFDAMRRTIETGDDGRHAATEALDGIERIQSETANTAQEMASLDDQMDEIGGIVGVITEIAEQTNILALNANIEAARAGEAGEGFAVVSNEVKNLAEETKASALQIEELIAALRGQQATVLNGVERMQTRVDDGSESVRSALDSLDEIIGEVDETNATVGEITDATSTQASAAQEIQAMTDDAASISDETAAQSENVSAAAQEQTASLAEVSNGTRELSQYARELRDHLAQFDVSDAGRSAAGAAPAAPAPTPPVEPPTSNGGVATDGGHGDD